MIPNELLPFLDLYAQRMRRIGIAAAIGFGLLVVPFVGLALSELLGEASRYVVDSCKGNEACLSRHRWDEATKLAGIALFMLVPAVIGLVVFIRNRSPLGTALAQAIAKRGEGLRAVYPQKTKVTAAGFGIGEFYEIVFERNHGDPWKWLVRAEQIDGVMMALRRSIPNVLTEPPPF